MTKSAFLRRLRLCLRWYCGFREADDVLSDYEGFFAAGAAEGESEEVLCSRFGSPRVIARELAGGKKHFAAVRLILAGLLLCWAVINCYNIGFGFLLYWDGPFYDTFEATNTASMAAVLLVPALVWALTLGSPFHLPKGGHTSWKPFLLVGVGELLAICLPAALVLYEMTMFSRDPDFKAILFGPFTFPVRYTSPLMVGMMIVCGVLLLLGLLFCLRAFWRGSYHVYPCVFLLLGGMYAVATMNQFLASVDDPRQIAAYVPVAVTLALSGLVAGLLFRLLLGRREGA